MALSDDIKGRLDIVDVVSQYVPELKKTGKNWSARCPFHQERTPSFVVFPDRQSWRCFGACAEGGDLFTFVMKQENLDFSAALRTLAQRAGVVISVNSRKAALSKSSPIHDVNEAAASFFRTALLAERGVLARTYLNGRGVGEEAGERFRLGYSPSTGDELLRQLESRGFSRDLLIDAGLITKSESGGIRDVFRARLMFPIRTRDGKIAGFGGRSMDDTLPKYLNSAQTAVFDKGALLYGLDLAKEGISQTGVVVVVEGYMDVIAAHEHGFDNVVASMGTALTENQVQLLRSESKTFVLALDPDEAGQEAMLRSLENSWHVFERQEAMAIGRSRRQLYQRSDQLGGLRIAVLPSGLDPDALIRQGKEEWQKIISEAVPFLEYLLVAMGNRLELSSSSGKLDAAERFFPIIAAMENPYEQDKYFNRLADLLDVSPATLQASVGRPRKNQRRQNPNNKASSAPFRNIERDMLDDYTLALIIQNPELLPSVKGVPLEHMIGQEGKAVLSAIRQADTMEGVYGELEEHLGDYLDQLIVLALPPADRTQRIEDLAACLRRLEERHLRELKIQEESVWAQAANEPLPDLELLSTLQEQMTSTNEKLKILFSGGSERR